MCFESPAYRAVIESDVAGIVALGADGLLFDECLHHGPSLLCFDTAHGHRAGDSVFGHDLSVVASMAELGGPEFLLAGEACYDGQLEGYHLSYHRSYEVDHLALTRFLHPSAALMTAITGFDERNLIGQALVRRYTLSYEPYHFKGRLEDFPTTTAYGRAMDELRTAWRAWFWDGEYLDELGASVQADDGSAHHPYAVYVPADGGHPGVAVANHDDVSRTLRVELDGFGEPLAAHLVAGDGWVLGRHDDGGTWFHIPASSAAVVLPVRLVTASPTPEPPP
jgi:hypothetical protein